MDFDPRSFAPINLTQYFPIAAETVFAAWTDLEIMKRWLFVSATSEIRKIDLDLRVGGKTEQKVLVLKKDSFDEPAPLPKN